MARSGIIFLLGIFCLASSIATDDFIQMLKNRRATRYCGTTLSEVLSVVCRGRYNTPPPVHDIDKREVTNKRLSLNNLEENSFHFPFISKSGTEIFMSKFRRRRRLKRGVYNECCENPCSYEVLRSYCA